MTVEALIDRRAQNYVRSLIRKRVHVQDIEDIVQEAFTKAVENFPRYKPGNFRAWVGVIAQRHINNLKRKRRPRRYLGVEVLDEFKPFYDPEGISRELDYALEVLNDHERALLYAIADGYSYEQCAEEFAIPIGTVMSRLMRARMKVRLILGR